MREMTISAMEGLADKALSRMVVVMVVVVVVVLSEANGRRARGWR